MNKKWMVAMDKKHDGLGLEKMRGINLSALLEPAAEKFRDVPLDLIREDGDNPRVDFDSGTLDELAATIRQRGVITPISVRADPERPDGYIVNHGHRRLRASRLAGRGTIPAVVDEDFRDEDRIIENIQRDNLSMFEVARYVGEKLSRGFKQKEVAALIGKSTAYVSNHVQLMDLPPLTGKVVGEGRVSDLTAINELAKAERKHSGAVKKFLSGSGEISRSAALGFRRSLVDGDRDGAADQEPGQKVGKAPPAPTRAEPPVAAAFAGDTLELTGGWKRGRLLVGRGERRGTLLLEKRPGSSDRVWVQYDNGVEREEALAGLKLLAVVPE